MTKQPHRVPLRAVGVRFAALAVIWWAAAEGSTYHPALALLLVAAAALSSAILSPPGAWRISLRRLPGFALWFIARSTRAGVDVAWRALQLRPRIQPGIIDYPLRLAPVLPQVFFITVVSLIPGTVSVSRRESSVVVHVLDEREDVAHELAELERRVGTLFVPIGRSSRD